MTADVGYGPFDRAGLVAAARAIEAAQNSSNDAAHDHLVTACRDAGVVVTDVEDLILHWVASGEWTVPAVVGALIRRAYDAGRASVGEAVLAERRRIDAAIVELVRSVETGASLAEASVADPAEHTLRLIAAFAGMCLAEVRAGAVHGGGESGE